MWRDQKVDAFVKEVHLEAKRYCAAKTVDLRFLRDAEVTTRLIGESLDIMTLELAATVYGKPHPMKEYFQFPLNWWEAFKLRFFSRKLQSRFPIKYEKIYVTLSETYPDFSPAVKGERVVVHVAAFSDQNRPLYGETAPY